MSSQKTLSETMVMPELRNVSSGIGLRAPYHADLSQGKTTAGFLEAHSENYFSVGGVPFEYAMKCRELYPVSLHGVGLSLGSVQGIDPDHLQKLKRLVDVIDPVLVSEHVSWSGFGGIAVPDLLPLPLIEESLTIIVSNIQRVQETLGRRILVENPSSYLSFSKSDIPEPQFLAEIAKRSGCGILLDINNIHVSAHNLGFDAREYIKEIPAGLVGEIHLAGYQVNPVGQDEIYIDAHNNPVYPAVWELYTEVLKRLGDVPTLIEWDNDLPALNVLLDEARKADDIRSKCRKGISHAA